MPNYDIIPLATDLLDYTIQRVKVKEPQYTKVKAYVMENGQIKLDGPRDMVLQNLRERSQKNMSNAEQAGRQGDAEHAHESAASA